MRPLHYISTDKPLYRPGESVYIRDVVLDGITNYPLAGDELNYNFVIKGPRGDEQASTGASLEASVGSAKWEIPTNAAGGIYTVRAENNFGGAPAERTFEVRAYRVPRLKTQIEFVRRGYLPGEECEAVVSIERAEGGLPENAVVTASAVLDGELLLDGQEVPFEDGIARVRFALPKEIEVGDGTLSFAIEDGGVIESAAKTIPVLVDNYTVNFYPEGGDLIAGVPNRVYIEALQRNGKGADLQGEVYAGDEKVADYVSRHDGRGSVSFTPALDTVYCLRIRNAATGQLREFPLPAAKAGAAVSATAAAYDFDAPLTVGIAASPNAPKAPAYVTLKKRDVELCRVKVTEGQDTAVLTADQSEGVLIATLYAADDTPLSERLLFRKPCYRVKVSFAGIEKPATPGGKVTLTVKTTNENGTPVSANVGITVTDASVLEMIDKREQAPRLPEMVYLENEVRSFADAAVYFDENDADAALKLDLLLGTQGWRRFIPVRRAEIEAEFRDALARAMAPVLDPPRALPHPRVRRFGGNKLFMVEDGMAIVEENGAPPVVLYAAATGAAPEAAMMAAPPEAPEAPVLMAKMVVFDADEAVGVNAKPLRALKRRGEVRGDVIGNGLVWVREYAHQVRPDRLPNDRVDFTETLYWNAGKMTDPRTGEAKIEFGLPDTIGSFRVMADAFGNNGALGEASAELQSVAPFYSEVKLPPFVTEGDIIDLPIVLVNSTDSVLKNPALVLTADGGLEAVQVPQVIENLQPGERRRMLAKVRARKIGKASVTVQSLAGNFPDTVKRELTVVSRLFPFEYAAGAKLSSEKPFVAEVEIPETVGAGTVKTAVQVFSSPAATMEAALAALLRQPHGCFEQTSSTNYPLVMAQQYFLSHSGVEPRKISEAQSLLEQGYAKLVSFECAKKGYEWFGDDPGHEALTAYGLMEFADMAKVMPVNQEMIETTRKWLLSRRDGKGEFQLNQRALDSFGRAPAPTTNAYIVWALLESGEKPESLKDEIAAVVKKAGESEDAYLHGLAANILWLAGKAEEAKSFAKKLAGWQQDDGAMSHLGETITCSGGSSQRLECTSLAALAWVRCGGEFIAATEKAMRYLAEECKNGRFGSTQSTVLVLKAINAYDAAFAKPLAAGALQLYVDGEKFGEAVAFTKDSTGVLMLPDCSLALSRPGKHRIELRMTDGSELSSAITVSGMTALPQNAGTVTVAAKLDRTQAGEGEPVELSVSVANNAPVDANLPLAVIAIPGGLEVRTAQLQELTKAGRIAAYELWDNAVVLYWRGLRPGETAVVPISLIAAIPGEYTAAASRAYLYYTDEDRQYIPGVSVRVTAAGQ